MTIEELIEKCKQMRAKAERAAAAFFLWLREVETRDEYVEVWKDAGISTFRQFINFGKLCEPWRYEAFVRGLDRIGADEALRLGAHLTIEAGRTRDESALPELQKRASAFLETEHVAPSAQTVERWRRELDKPQRQKHTTIRRVDKIAQLEAENKRLKADLRAAEKKIAQLEKQIGKKAA